MVQHVAQPSEIRRSGTARVAQRGDAAGSATIVGVAAHVVCIDEDVGMNVDQSGGDDPTFGADRAPSFAGWQGWCDRGDLAAGDADIHDATKARRGIDNFPAGQQKIVFHLSPSPGLRPIVLRARPFCNVRRFFPRRGFVV